MPRPIQSHVLNQSDLRLLRRIVLSMFVLGAINSYLGLILPGATTSGRVSQLVLAMVLTVAGLLVALGPKDLYAELDAKYVERLNTWQIEAAKLAVYFRPGSPCEPLAAQIRPPTGYQPPEPL